MSPFGKWVVYDKRAMVKQKRRKEESHCSVKRVSELAFRRFIGMFKTKATYKSDVERKTHGSQLHADAAMWWVESNVYVVLGPPVAAGYARARPRGRGCGMRHPIIVLSLLCGSFPVSVPV